MILLLDTSTPECRLALYENGTIVVEDVWRADRELAEKIFSYLEEKMATVEKSWTDISAIGLFRGPGSFTGLRIGASVCNALAHDQQIPIVGTVGENWRQAAIVRLENGEDDKLVLPEYGRPARITQPRK